MYTRKNYSLKDMVRWTRSDLYKFIVIAMLPVAFYSLFKWLHLPWLPIALIVLPLHLLLDLRIMHPTEGCRKQGRSGVVSSILPGHWVLW